MNLNLFKGRISRTKYWVALLSWFLIGGAILAVPEVHDAFVTTISGSASRQWQLSPASMNRINFWAAIYGAAGLLLIPVRRLHDTNRSGYWTLLNFIPGLGIFGMILYCGFFPSCEEDNRF